MLYRGPVALCVVVVLPACGLVSNRAAGLPLGRSQTVVASEGGAGYVIAPGDRLRVRYVGVPRLDDELAVRTDGRIALPVVGEMEAAGRTTAQLTLDLVLHAGEALENVDPAVEVVHTGGSMVSVGGEVREPRRLNVLDASTVAEAVRRAGGVLFSGDRSSVVLLRQGNGRAPHAFRVPLGPEGDGLAGEVPLRAHDVVFVPKTRAARLVVAAEQYVLALLPVPGRFAVYQLINRRQPAGVAVAGKGPVSAP